MTQQWALYDQLIDAIPANLRAVAVAQGGKWTRCLSESGSCGAALTMSVTPSQGAATPRSVHDRHAGARLRELAELVKSWDFAEASIGLAAINAYFSDAEVARANGFEPTPPVEPDAGRPSFGDVFTPFVPYVRGQKVAVIGHFPFAREALADASDFCMLERDLRPGDVPDSACEYLLPERDHVFITGSALVNKTAPRLFELSRRAASVLLGPSAPMAPQIMEHWGIDVICGLACEDGAGLFEALGTPGFPQMLDHAYRAERHGCGSAMADAAPTATVA